MNTNSRKDKYVAKAISILKQEGFRLSLDEMATKMGITKKTLYNNFSSKEELLNDEEVSAIESLTRCFAQLDELFVTLNPVFFSDLMRSNPDQAMLEHVMGSSYFKEQMTINLQRGVQAGLYRADLDIPFVCEYMSYSIFGFYIQAVIRSKPLPSGSYFASILQYHLRAIVSTHEN